MGGRSRGGRGREGLGAGGGSGTTYRPRWPLVKEWLGAKPRGMAGGGNDDENMLQAGVSRREVQVEQRCGQTPHAGVGHLSREEVVGGNLRRADGLQRLRHVLWVFKHNETVT